MHVQGVCVLMCLFPARPTLALHKQDAAEARPQAERGDTEDGMGDDAPTACNVVDPPRRHRLLQWRRGLGRRRKLPVVRLGGGRGGRRARGSGILRRLRLRWLRRAVSKLAAIYMAALAGPPPPHQGGASSSSSFPPWIGVEACFATAFVPTARPFW